MASNRWDATSRPFRIRLSVHSEPVTEPVIEPVTEPVVEPVVEPVKPEPPKKTAEPKPGEADLGDNGKKVLDQERARAKDAAASAKAAAAAEAAAKAENAKLLARIQEFEDRDKSELEKAQATAERNAARAEAADRRVVATEIRLAAAAAEFVDPSDAISVLGTDLASYVQDGVVDTAAIEAAVADLLEKKPHWKKLPAPAAPVVEPPKRATPAPVADPAQGARGGTPVTDFRKAPKADVDAELAKYNIRP